MSNGSIIGVDISKRSFQLHGATAEGAVVLRRKGSIKNRGVSAP